MTKRIMLLAGTAFALAVSLPAGAQTPAVPQSAPIPQNGDEVQIDGGVDIGTALGAGALPGVGIGNATEATETTPPNVPSGPGGLQNSVGAEGVMAPDLSGAAGQTGGGVPGTGTTQSGVGIPIETDPAQPFVPPVE